MSLGTWLDTAIGVALFFLAMSFLVSAVVEAIAQVLAWRATTLRDGIANLLNSVGLPASARETGAAATPNVLTALYDHSLMRGLYDNSKRRVPTLAANLGNGTLPSYVPGNVFASALLDVVTTNGPLSTARTALAAAEAAVRTLRDAASGQPREQAIAELDERVGRLEAAIASALAEIAPAAQRGLARLTTRGEALAAQRRASDAAGDAGRVAALDAMIRSVESDRARLEAGARTWTDALDKAEATTGLGTLFAALRAAIAAPHESGDPRSWASRMAGIDAAFAPLRTAAARPLDALAAVASDADRWIGGARDLVARIESPELRAALSAMLEDTDATVADLRKTVAAWFDTAMDRVSGWYKRRVQLTSFLIGLAVAVAINADAINVVRTIATNETLRGELVALAQTAAKESDEKERAKVLQEKLGVLPIGWFIAECVDRVTGQDCRGEDAGDLATPWSDRQWRATARYATWSSVIDSTVHLHWSPLTILGWLITAVAVKLGAPFWFDLLSSLLRIRAAGKVPARSAEKTGTVAGGGAAP